MIAHHPLGGGSALIAFDALTSRVLLKQKPIRRAVARVILLVLLTPLLLYDGIVPYQPLQPGGAPYRDTFAGKLKTQLREIVVGVLDAGQRIRAIELM